MNRKHLLVGLLYCGKCGQNMICQKRKRRDCTEYKKYICKTYHQKGRESCDQPNLDSDRIEGKVIVNLKNEIAIKLSGEECFNDNQDTVYEKLNFELEEVDEKLEQSKKDTVNLIKSKELFSNELFKQTAETLNKEHELLIRDREFIQFQINNLDNISDTLKNEMYEWISIENSNEEEIREFITTFIQRIDVVGEKISVTYNFLTNIC